MIPEDMKTGTYISGAGHAGLFVWLLIGGFFVSHDDFEAITATDVSIITEDQLDALRPSGPETGEAPPALNAPAADEPAPAVVETPDDVVEPPEEAPQLAEAQPETPVEIEEPAQPDVVEPDVAAPEEPEGDPGDVVVVPDAEPVPRQEDVIAPEITEVVEPEVEVDEVAQTETASDEAAEVVQEEVDTTTTEAPTTTEIVTEADEPATGAPTKSVRPGRKPTPPAPAETEVAEPTEPTETPAVPGLEDLINEAVTEANQDNAVEDNASPGGGSGEPITRAEKGAFILAIQKCWNVGALGSDALKVTVIVGFTMTPDAKPEIGSIRLVGAEGGTGGAVDRAYEAARRAIIRCGSAGFGLPPEKYNIWRGVEVKFNATTKEIR